MRARLLRVALLCAFALSPSIGCQAPSPPPSPFDRERAWQDLLTQCAFGPRVPGSAAHAQCADWIVERFEEAGWHVQRDPFTARVALLRQEIGMQNILATRSPDAQPELILTAHWDTRPIADQDPDPANRDRPILGASDGASGVAVLLEVARCLTEADAERVGFVLYDGEDLGTAPRPDQWCLGSKHFAAVTLPALGWPVARGINIDLVGDRDLQLKRELNSDTLAPEWTDLVWRLGQRRHPDVYVDQTREVYDDHMPLLSRGIPHIDIIDIEFSAWHTLQDTPEACSADSLAIVGEVLLDVVRTLGAEGARPGRESGSGKRNEPDAGP